MTKQLKVIFWDQTVENVKVFFDKMARGAKKTTKQCSTKEDGAVFFRGLWRNSDLTAVPLGRIYH